MNDTYSNEMMQLSYHDMPNFPNKNPRENAVIQDGCSIGKLRVKYNNNTNQESNTRCRVSRIDQIL